jgi:hypothetical protein
MREKRLNIFWRTFDGNYGAIFREKWRKAAAISRWPDWRIPAAGNVSIPQEAFIEVLKA